MLKEINHDTLVLVKTHKICVNLFTYAEKTTVEQRLLLTVVTITAETIFVSCIHASLCFSIHSKSTSLLLHILVATGVKTIRCTYYLIY